MQVFQVPEGSRTSKGRAIINLLPLQPEERVVKLVCTRGMEGKVLVMVTKNGIIKRTDAMEFAKIRSTGIRAVTLREKDELIFCSISSGTNHIILATAHGQGIRFKEDEVRVMGRQAAGVMGIRLRSGDTVVGMEVISDGGDILFATEKGYGKRVRLEDFRVAHRGGLGVRTIPTSGRNGSVIALVLVSDNSHLLLIDEAGKIIRLSPNEIRTMGRQAQGVRLIRLDQGQRLATVAAFEEDVTAVHEPDDSHQQPGGSATGRPTMKMSGDDDGAPLMDEYTSDVPMEEEYADDQEALSAPGVDDEEVMF
jgi:DNA gyrase subunit A